MGKYYYLVAGLPKLALEDNKLSYTVADFKEDIYPALTVADKKLVSLFFLQYDNANVLKLLKDREAAIDGRGVFSAEELNEYILRLKEGDRIENSMFPAWKKALNIAAPSAIFILPSFATSPMVCIPLFKTAGGCALSAV